MLATACFDRCMQPNIKPFQGRRRFSFSTLSTPFLAPRGARPVFDANQKDRRERRGPSAARGRPGGFTLIELIVVMVIIGILISLVLIASANAVQTAREKATQGLIAKLDAALVDRIDAILQSQTGEPTGVQQLVARTYGAIAQPLNAPTPDRAYALAQIELFLREVPDVFYVQAESTGYPLNFAANPYPIANGSPNAVASAAPTAAKYVLPLGTGWPVNPITGSTNYFNPGQGIYGASYNVAAGLYKNLGYLPAGYDGVDNNGDGVIDDWSEGVGTNTAVRDQVRANLASHQHKTARAEVLYALLVEAQGPFGSIFNREDFTDLEVMDTDGDGLPEFVDGWGEPLQFYRWPVFYHSDLQRGLRFVSDDTGATKIAAPYDGMIDQREQAPLDPNQQLMAPAWWSPLSDPYGNALTWPPFLQFPAGFAPSGGATWSAGVVFFENYFYRLREPLSYGSATDNGLFWDRGASYGGAYGARRAYFTKFLIVSSGPDKELGLFQYTDAGLKTDLATAASSAVSPSYPLIGLESTAAPLAYADLVSLAGAAVGTAGSKKIGDAISAASADIQAKGQDDISNHNIPAGGIGGSTP